MKEALIKGVAVILLVLGMCSGFIFAESNPESSTADDIELRVMTFNIWQGGAKVSFAKTIEAIKTAKADIIGIQESYGNMARLARDLGFYYDEKLQILSRYPLMIPRDSGGLFALVKVADGKVVAVSNVHLRAFPYGPYMLRDGQSVKAALNNEAYHMTQINPTLKALKTLADAGVPVFLTGDFNVPSYLDWTEEAAKNSNETFRQAIIWPVSKALEEAGFRDTYRAIYPDPLTHPGFTWTPGYPVPEMDEGEVHDRIDFVYAAGKSVTINSEIVAEDGPLTDIVITPWPTDHRSVVSTFSVTPFDLSAFQSISEIPVPSIKAEKDVYAPGEDIKVEFANGSGDRQSWIGILPRGVAPKSVPTYRWGYINGQVSGEFLISETTEGTTWPLPQGKYTVYLFADNGHVVLASGNFTVE